MSTFDMQWHFAGAGTSNPPGLKRSQTRLAGSSFDSDHQVGSVPSSRLDIGQDLDLHNMRR